MSIKISSVYKKYKNQVVLNNITFSGESGEIIGFLGPNGAGKSTTMKILTGYIKPNKGEVYVNDINVLENPIKSQSNIGYLPEHNPLYKDMYVKEYLNFRASIYNVSKVEIEKAIEKVGLTPEINKKIHQLSKGYQQRVGIAAAILHNPKVLILDEPTTGLDPNQLLEIRDLIKELGKDKTVLFSTHIMQEVEAVCNRVIIINKGELILDKKLNELQNNNSQTINITFNKLVNFELFSMMQSIDTIKQQENNAWQLTFSTSEDMRSKIFDFSKENDLKILELTLQNKSLETLFKELTN